MLTVLDFIGQQRCEFRFDLRYRALTGYGRKELEKAVEDEFPYLPSGSRIVLDRVAQKVVLDNTKVQFRFNRAQLVRDIASYAETELEAYLERSGNDMKTFYRSTRDSWTGYPRQAGLIEGALTPGDRAPGNARGAVGRGGKEAAGPDGGADPCG